MRRTQIGWGVAAFILAVLSLVLAICAAEATGVSRNSNGLGEPFVPDASISLGVAFHESENLSLGAVTESSGGEESASELSRKLANPVSSVWSIESQFNNFELNNGQWNNNWNFQPVLPVGLTKDWNLITRPVSPGTTSSRTRRHPASSRATPGWAT
jgi:hypothetical protein